MIVSNEKRWEQFVLEVKKDGFVWTIEKDGEYVTSNTRHGTKAFPWWSSRNRVLKQLKQVPVYAGYQQAGFEWSVFLNEWVPSLSSANCLLGINYAGIENVGFDLPIQEVINAVRIAHAT